MSLVATWCKCNDGQWYEQPMWTNKDPGVERYDWFVCLDDDEPPELVVKTPLVIPTTHPLWDWFTPMTKWKLRGERCFSRASDWSDKYHPAIRRFGKIVLPPPPPAWFASVEEIRPARAMCWLNI